jgi:hypothetical protein
VQDSADFRGLRLATGTIEARVSGAMSFTRFAINLHALEPVVDLGDLGSDRRYSARDVLDGRQMFRRSSGRQPLDACAVRSSSRGREVRVRRCWPTCRCPARPPTTGHRRACASLVGSFAAGFAVWDVGGDGGCGRGACCLHALFTPARSSPPSVAVHTPVAARSPMSGAACRRRGGPRVHPFERGGLARMAPAITLCGPAKA